MNLNNLPKTTNRKKKILGRGIGSGKGKTAGRGTKGQKARGKIPLKLGFGGTIFVRRLPLYRGKYRNKPHGKKLLVVNLKYLNILPKNSVVDIDLLIAHNIIRAKDVPTSGVKILGEGKLEKALTVKLPCSKRASKKIESAGGSVKNE